jgi:hypothetical protein
MSFCPGDPKARQRVENWRAAPHCRSLFVPLQVVLFACLQYGFGLILTIGLGPAANLMRVFRCGAQDRLDAPFHIRVCC